LKQSAAKTTSRDTEGILAHLEIGNSVYSCCAAPAEETVSSSATREDVVTDAANQNIIASITNKSVIPLLAT
jgi:hypothetical protein